MQGQGQSTVRVGLQAGGAVANGEAVDRIGHQHAVAGVIHGEGPEGLRRRQGVWRESQAIGMTSIERTALAVVIGHGVIGLQAVEGTDVLECDLCTHQIVIAKRLAQRRHVLPATAAHLRHASVLPAGHTLAQGNIDEGQLLRRRRRQPGADAHLRKAIDHPAFMRGRRVLGQRLVDDLEEASCVGLGGIHLRAGFETHRQALPGQRRQQLEAILKRVNGRQVCGAIHQDAADDPDPGSGRLDHRQPLGERPCPARGRDHVTPCPGARAA